MIDTASTPDDSYRLIQTLASDRSFLCCDSSGNVVVLQKLEADCLPGNRLHPGIRDRLSRIRELPLAEVAPFRGVERWNHAQTTYTCMVWLYLDGQNWEEQTAQAPDQFPQLASSFAATIATLHELGIVHGNLHPRNVIVRPTGQVWITHLSPYLFVDPQVDLAALVHIMRQSGLHLSAARVGRLNDLLDQTENQRIDLRELSHELSKLDEPKDNASQAAMNGNSHARQRSLRQRSVMLAFTVLISATLLSLGIRRFILNRRPVEPVAIPAIKHDDPR